MKIVHTNGQNPDFIELCRLLDQNLDEIVGETFQREKYDKYNQLNDIHNAVIIYTDKEPVAGGGYKHYNKTTAEIKRIFVKKQFRRQGYSRILMKEIEAMAKKDGYKKLILETGELLQASMALYKKIGFAVIENYGQYKNMQESVCMEKILTI